MGLDMYAYRIEKSRARGVFSVDFSGISDEEKSEKTSVVYLLKKKMAKYFIPGANTGRLTA